MMTVRPSPDMIMSPTLKASVEVATTFPPTSNRTPTDGNALSLRCAATTSSSFMEESRLLASRRIALLLRGESPSPRRFVFAFAECVRCAGGDASRLPGNSNVGEGDAL